MNAQKKKKYQPAVAELQQHQKSKNITVAFSRN